jgi:hypothetical protein
MNLFRKNALHWCMALLRSIVGGDPKDGLKLGIAENASAVPLSVAMVAEDICQSTINSTIKYCVQSGQFP